MSDFADRISVILHVELELSGFECSILHCLLTFRCSLTFSLVDIDECIRKFKDAIFSSDCSIIHIRNNINCTVSVIGHSDSQIIGMIVICDAIRGGLRSLLTYRVIVLCIPFSVCSSLVEEVRININRVLAILFDDLCGILVSRFFTVLEHIIDTREYDVTLIDILVSVLRRNNSVVRIIQCQIELKLFDSELSAFDLLLDTENQSAFSLILIFKVREVNVVVCICLFTIDRNRFDDEIGFIRIQSYSYNNGVRCFIICNTRIRSLDFLHCISEFCILKIRNDTFIILNRRQIAGIECDSVKYCFAVTSVFGGNCITRLGGTGSSIFSRQAECELAFFKSLADQALKGAKLYVCIKRLIIRCQLALACIIDIGDAAYCDSLSCFTVVNDEIFCILICRDLISYRCLGLFNMIRTPEDDIVLLFIIGVVNL